MSCSRHERSLAHSRSALDDRRTCCALREPIRISVVPPRGVRSPWHRPLSNAARAEVSRLEVRGRSTLANFERFQRYALWDRDFTRARDPDWFDAFSAYTVARARDPDVKATMRRLVSTRAWGVPDDQLARIDVPTSLLGVMKTEWRPFGSHGWPQGRHGWPLVVIDRAGHVPHIEQGDAFVTALEEICRGFPRLVAVVAHDPTDRIREDRVHGNVGDPRRVGVARADRAVHGPGCTEGPADGRTRHRLFGVRPDGAEPACRPSDPTAYPAAFSAGRSPADRAGRRRDGDDRRPKETGERTLTNLSTVADWTDRIRGQLERFVDFDDSPSGAVVENNLTWTGEMATIEFLRDVGKHFSVNVMLDRDTVRRRLQGEGISYTEFSYMCCRPTITSNCIDAMTARCRSVAPTSGATSSPASGWCARRRARRFTLTTPLVTDSEGNKFGKSTGGGNLWLDPEMTSPYAWYQYFVNTADADAVPYLKWFASCPATNWPNSSRQPRNARMSGRPSAGSRRNSPHWCTGKRNVQRLNTPARLCSDGAN